MYRDAIEPVGGGDYEGFPEVNSPRFIVVDCFTRVQVIPLNQRLYLSKKEKILHSTVTIFADMEPGIVISTE